MNIMISILSIALTIDSAVGAVKPFDPNLPKPTFPEESTNDASLELKKLLDKGETGEFFKKATTEIDQLCALEAKGEALSKEDSKALLWIFYLIANTPILAMDSTENVRWAADNSDADLALKEYTMSILAIDRYRDLTPKYKGANELFASYGAAIMQDFLNQIRAKTYSDKSLVVSDEEVRASTKRSLEILLEDGPAQVIEEKLRNHQEQFRNYRLKINMQDRRNSRMKDIIRHSEKDFMILLLDLFPGKSGEVRKYIKMAGYTTQEIRDLLDRTVGREPRTEFLYKGLSKRR